MNSFFTIFALGGYGYIALEYLWRGRSHWSMFILGGLCLYSLFRLFDRMQNSPIFLQAIAGSLVITLLEFAAGCILNLYLNLNVWSYSSMPFNLFGQVCLPYSILWILLSIPISLLCRFFRQHVR